MNHHFLKPLPKYLVMRYQKWKDTTFNVNKKWYIKLAEDGQHPRAMIISCCDSRVHVTSIFGSDAGEFFIHRNIANLVPPFKIDLDYHGTSAAIEYAVTTLKIPHIIVLGHSTCGGVNSSYEYFSGKNPNLYNGTNFIGPWLEMLRPAFEDLNPKLNSKDKIQELEKKTVLLSLQNLTTFPFIKKALENKSISLHGLWHNIGSGELEFFDTKTNKFILV